MKTRNRCVFTFIVAIATLFTAHAQDYDWGDAPQPSYQTTSAANGARHAYVPHIYMGNLVDIEPDGQPEINANGDDNDVLYPSVGDDEDGVTFNSSPLQPGTTPQITVVASVNGYLDAWIDYNQDGIWGPAEKIGGGSIALVAGSNTIGVTIPGGATPGWTFARFRFSTAGSLVATGPAQDGEVEDYMVRIEGGQQQEMDWGDAPDSIQAPRYPTLSANNGANHMLGSGLFLGYSVDSEGNGQPNFPAMGDDNDTASAPINDDEDGVLFTSLMVPGQAATVTVIASQAGQLDAWVDFNGNGSWMDLGEQIFPNKTLVPGFNYLTFNVPASATVGPTYARFRISTAGNLPPVGTAADGEVEDYIVWVDETEEDHKMHYPQYPDPNGWDVRACFSQSDGKQKVLADDFRCTSNGLITQITFWGSWYNNETGQVENIHLSLHLDDRSGEYSKPGTELWNTNINPLAQSGVVVITEEEPSWQGWIDPNEGIWAVSNHMRYFRYDVSIDPADAFEQREGTIYWLDVSLTTATGSQWGWKTSRSPHFEDDATWADLPIVNSNQWRELIDPIYSNSLDLAFIINETDLLDWGDAPDPAVAAGFNTLAANSGANHTIVQGMFLGALIDSEQDGQPDIMAMGDDFATSDDEDGVVFAAILPGLNANVQVTASMPGFIDAWMDFDASGTWTAGDQIFASTSVTAGVNNLTFAVPNTAVSGLSFARFRYSSAGGLPPTGPAADGEVEDHMVSIEPPIDWGDAPDPTYPTLAASSGANHAILGGGLNPTLGLLVDPELDGQPTMLADGDDLAINDDEDGVTFVTPLIPGTVAQIDVYASGSPGMLQGWIDFNGNGSWADPGEQIFINQLLGAGNNSLYVAIPPSAPPVLTYARFRYSSTGGLGVTGSAQDGEVEDYYIEILPPEPIDWGDAPDSVQAAQYPTLAIHNGAHHVIAAPGLGPGPADFEPDGQPDATATGDDLAFSDDEDGVTFTSLIMPGGYASVDIVVAPIPGILDAWIDFNADNDWADAGEQIFSGQVVTTGTNSLIYPVPVTATPGITTFARFRISSAGVSSYTGLAIDGEVEDYSVNIELIESQATDWGDALDLPYPTLSAAGGPNHVITPGIMLGATIDNEPDGQPDPLALGDDMALLDDEDGVSFASKVVAGSNITINVVAGVLPGALLDGWIDYNADGDWMDAGEQIFISQPVSPGLNALPITVPQPTALGQTFARFRISTAGGLSPIGPALDGEVEDYTVDLYQPQTSTNIIITNITIIASNATAKVEWNAENNITYQMEASTNLVVSNWTAVGSSVLGPTDWQTNAISTNDVQFYRITAPWTE